MRYLLVQPYANGSLRFEQATVVDEFDSAEGAFQRLEWYAHRLHEQHLPAETLQLFVVDERRRPVLRGQ